MSGIVTELRLRREIFCASQFWAPSSVGGAVAACSMSVHLVRLSHFALPSSLLVDVDSLDFSARASVKKLIITGPIWCETDEMALLGVADEHLSLASQGLWTEISASIKAASQSKTST